MASVLNNTYEEMIRMYPEVMRNDVANLLGIVHKDAPRFLLTELYRYMVRAKECTPLEELDPDGKQQLWEEAKRLSSNKKVCIEICKSIHALGSYYNLH